MEWARSQAQKRYGIFSISSTSFSNSCAAAFIKLPSHSSLLFVQFPFRNVSALSPAVSVSVSESSSSLAVLARAAAGALVIRPAAFAAVLSSTSDPTLLFLLRRSLD
jgi:hypothetical protein